VFFAPAFAAFAFQSPRVIDNAIVGYVLAEVR